MMDDNEFEPLDDPDLWRKERDNDEHGIGEPDPFPVDDGSRHVLIVEDGGLAYIAPHLGEKHSDLLCARIREAWLAFRGEEPIVDGVPFGRYWCDVDEDGNFAIGSRLPDEVTQ